VDHFSGDISGQRGRLLPDPLLDPGSRVTDQALGEDPTVDAGNLDRIVRGEKLINVVTTT